MELNTLIAQLRTDAVRGCHRRDFELARRREAALAAHRDVESVLLALKDTSPGTYPTRDRVICAMLRQHQRSKTRLWASALTVAFAPMLLRLQARARNGASDSVQLVLEGFLVAIAMPWPRRRGACLAAALRRQTSRFVFARLRAERRLAEDLRRLEHLARNEDGFDLFAQPIGAHPRPAEAEGLAELLYEAVGSRVPKHKLDVVVATRLRGLSLREHILRAGVPGGDGGEPFNITLQRAKREHSRTLNQLRPVLASAFASARDWPSTESGLALAS